ncbi:hypothetical protein BT96DRAFT_1004694 [Gymnopus androsaceus JB14]|uniref:Uncharacterized protein n=1 Tax=Gymnopus androsaceus JB14 TaxID=1447944 RepID=A0A6A4GQH5_9AGAR|nr:hypothetical protein BT96DRAFT_1004694 [Gymnopus androsaceus JB14]
MFKKAHDFSIKDSTFNVIHGDLITYVTESSSKRHREEEEEEDKVIKKRHRDLLHILDDFHQYKRGDILILESISSMVVVDEDLGDEIDIDCTKIISPAVKASTCQQKRTSIDVSSINKKKYLTITYEGDKVQERWYKDFQLFSQTRYNQDLLFA